MLSDRIFSLFLTFGQRSGRLFLFFGLVLGLFHFACKPQRPQVLEGDRPKIYEDSVEKAPERKVKPPKRGVYYGIKTRKAYVKVVKNKKRTFELFHVLAKYQEPSIYNVHNLYWYNRKKRRIVIGPIPEKELMYARILHGPYRRTFESKTVEEGIFYLGAKHGRWENTTATKDEILTDKVKWYKGFPKESEISYYDVELTQIKEVIPIVNEEKHGDYFYFSPTGNVLISGKYEYGKKIGTWTEYYDGVGKKHGIKQKSIYPESSFVPQFEGYINQQFDAKGNITYDKLTEENKAKAKKAAEEKAAKEKSEFERLNPPK
jgi:hypothetical protein